MIYDTARIKFLLFAILFLGAAVEIFAAAGDLDWTFGNDGLVMTDNGSDSEGVTKMLVQPDGKIIAVGYSHINQNATRRSVIVRYNPNGSIDASFGSGGRIIIQSIEPGSVTLQTDGKIVYCGIRNVFPFGFFVARFNADGSLDTTFAGVGYTTADLRGTGDRAHSVQIQTDGKIVVGGTSLRPPNNNLEDFALARFNADGSLDTTFDGDGKVFTEIIAQNQNGYFADMVIQPDGKILAVGSRDGSVVGQIVMIRYNSNGSLDTTFDGDGMVFTGFDPEPPSTQTGAYANSAILQPDGKIVLGGTAFISGDNSFTRPAAVRYNTDGSLDSSFGNGGKAIIVLSGVSGSSGNAVAIQADNKLVIGGTAYVSNATDAMLMRLNANGSLDTTFSGDGVNLIVSPTNRTAVSNAVVIQPGGKIVIGGYVSWTGSEFLLARFESSTCTVNCAPRREVIADFDGDGKTDLSVFRDPNWFINPSSANNPNAYTTTQFATNPTNLTPLDFDGDGKSDIAVWRTNQFNNIAAFLILRSSTNTFRETLFGLTGDDPRVAGDWDFDGRADAAVYRAAANAGEQSYFYYIPSSAPETLVTIPWGTAGDVAARGDFDGDGQADAAVFRPSNGVWYVRRTSNGQPIFQPWGIAGDKLVSGDFDGDLKTDFTVYRDGIWYVLQSSNNQPRYVSWGISGDKVVAGDYDGDGKTDFAVWRAGVYYIMQNSNSQAAYYNFGLPSDIPVASAFVR